MTPSSITSSNAPILLATVGTFTKAASIHLISDFAALKIVFSSGHIFISTEAMYSGNFFQSTNGYLTILSSNLLNFSGKFNSPTTHNITFLCFSIIYCTASAINSISALCVILPLKYPILINPDKLFSFSFNLFSESSTIFSDAVFLLINTLFENFNNSICSCCVVVITPYVINIVFFILSTFESYFRFCLFDNFCT